MYKHSPLSKIIWDIAYGASHVPSVTPYTDVYAKWVVANRAGVARKLGQAYLQQVRIAYKRKVTVLAKPLPGSVHVDLDAFTDYLWKHPEWCPATRLQFEALQLLFVDAKSKANVSDLNDFTRFKTVTYVDVFTADAARRDYLRSLREGKKSRVRYCSYWSCAVAKDLAEVFVILESSKNGTAS